MVGPWWVLGGILSGHSPNSVYTEGFSRCWPSSTDLQHLVPRELPGSCRGAAGQLPARMPPLSHSHYSCILVSADKTSVVSADKTSVVSADKTSVVSLCQQTSPKTSPSTFPTQGRPCRHKKAGAIWRQSGARTPSPPRLLGGSATLLDLKVGEIQGSRPTP